MAEMTLESIFTPEIIADPYPLYRQLREGAPILKVPDSRTVVLTRYRDVQAVLKDKRLGHMPNPDLTPEQLAARARSVSISNLEKTMLLQNPPDHTRLRSLVVGAFNARSVAALQERIRSLVTTLIDGFISDGAGDLVRLFNHPLPVLVICDLLGIPEADWDGFTQGSRVSGRLIDPTPMTAEELAAADANTAESLSYFRGLCDQRRVDPQDDLLTALVESETEHGMLTNDELAANISLLFAAGHETTVNLLGNALLALFRNPEQLALLRAQPERMETAVEEFLRYDSSVQISGRGAFEAFELDGVEIPRLSQVLTILGAANRDPETFSEPDRLDVTRAEAKPISFGGGIHYCLGAQLAKLEAAEALKQLLERMPNLQLDAVDAPAWKQTITLRGLQSLPAHW